MILVLLGPPGSGKGTQAKKVASERNWPQLSTGDMLRAAILRGTQLGLEAKSFMDKGALVPDSVVIGLIAERTLQRDCSGGFVLDGFPRTLGQAEALDELLAARQRKIENVISFEIPDQNLVSRLSGRRTCPKCGSMFHIATLKPKKDGICDQCGTALEQRADDHEDVIRKRLVVYHDQTAPLVEYYKAKGVLHALDATRSPEAVHNKLNEIVEKNLPRKSK